MQIQLLPSAMLPAGAITAQQQQMHLMPHLYHQSQQQQQANAVLNSMRHRRGSTSSGDDSEDSKECDADSTSPTATSGTTVNMATTANIHSVTRMDT